VKRAGLLLTLQGASGRPLFLCLALTLAACSAGPVAARCPAPAERQAITVRHVIDGDTVVLGDGRHLRLVGINAPELGKDGAPDQPGAAAARDALRAALAGTGLTLAIAPEPRDRHRRWLGDLYDARGRSAQELLIETGKALAVAVPPNLNQVACLFDAEARARKAGRGLWAEPAAWTLRAAEIARDQRGFALLAGRITGRRETRAGVALALEDRMELWIPRERVADFGAELAWLRPGVRVEARGWLGSHRGRPNLRLEHPTMVEVRP
jgi:micrococcal nuclease